MQHREPTERDLIAPSAAHAGRLLILIATIGPALIFLAWAVSSGF